MTYGLHRHYTYSENTWKGGCGTLRILLTKSLLPVASLPSTEQTSSLSQMKPILYRIQSHNLDFTSPKQHQICQSHICPQY